MPNSEEYDTGEIVPDVPDKCQTWELVNEHTVEADP